jgi:hypothetical protein
MRRGLVLCAAAVLVLAVAGVHAEGTEAPSKDEEADPAASKSPSPPPADAGEEEDEEAPDDLGDYKYWRRKASYNEYSEDDFDRSSDPRMKGQGAEVLRAGDPLAPRFQWFQDQRQVKITLRVKRLTNITMEVDERWLNFSAIGDFQRVVTSHHFKQEQGEQSAKRAQYALQLPLKYKVVGAKTKRLVEAGWTVITLRKAARGKDWKHLLTEPANTVYSKQMIRDWKKYGGTTDDVEFLVQKAKSLDEVLARGSGVTLVQFTPSWSDQADTWAGERGANEAPCSPSPSVYQQSWPPRRTIHPRARWQLPHLGPAQDCVYFMIRTEAVAEFPLRFCSFHLRRRSVRWRGRSAGGRRHPGQGQRAARRRPARALRGDHVPAVDTRRQTAGAARHAPPPPRARPRLAVRRGGSHDHTIGAA